MNQRPITDWLPITKKEIDMRGWDEVDVVIISGDAYVDHPSFGAAVIGRVLEQDGYRVAIIPQPNWQDDLRDFKKFGKPKLFFGVTAGSMDSMVNHYTAAKRLRSDDAYTPGDKAGFRPDYPTIVYSQILKKLYPDTPVVIGGIEASLRRFTHYDYWQNKLKPSILLESGADILVYGMGERPVKEIAARLKSGGNEADLKGIKQTSMVFEKNSEYVNSIKDSAAFLSSYEACLSDKKKFGLNFKIIEEESNVHNARILIENQKDHAVVVFPPFPLMTTIEIDAIYDLPYTRLPHPKYQKRGVIPAYEMIRHSVNIHRGCFGGCSFCTISAHQGKEIASRSKKSIHKEVEKVIEMDDFKGYLSDLGGPSANMYMMNGKNQDLCASCRRNSCVFPAICKNLNHDHAPLLNLYKEVEKYSAIKKVFIGSGVRYDLFLQDLSHQPKSDNKEYAEHLIKYNVSGRLKVAPEHTEPHVLDKMRKPSFTQFEDFKQFFDETCRRSGLNQQLIPYFISAHPACRLTDMQNLQRKTAKMGYKLEQVQDFTPTPMTLSSTIFYMETDPYTGEKVYVAKNQTDKKTQRDVFFWYKKGF